MVTKRQLGIGLAIAGLLVIGGVFAVDLLEAGQHQGLGSLQRLALAAASILTLIGLSLVPLGSRPA